MTSRFDPKKSSRTTTLHRGFELFGEQMPLIGRRKELRVLLKALEDCRENSALQFIAMNGQEGMGKTRLLYELAAHADENGVSVYRLRCSSREAHAQSRLAAQVVRHRFKIPPFLHAEKLREKLRLSLEPLIPERRLGDAVRLFGRILGLPNEAETEEVRELLTQRAFKSVVALIKRDARKNPVLVLADRMDEASLHDQQFLAQLVEDAAEFPVYLAMAMRNIAAVPPALKYSPNTLSLKGLSKPETEKLALSLLQRMETPPREIVVAVRDKSGGIPGNMEQILRTLASKGIIDTGERPWKFRADRLKKTAIPNSVLENAKERLGSLDKKALSILQKASVMGPRFWFGGVLSLMRVEREPGEAYWIDDRKRHRLNRILMDLQSIDLVHFESESSVRDQIEFVFQNNHEAKLLRDQIDPSQKRVYHRLLAQWMRSQLPLVRDTLNWHLKIADHEEAGGRPSRSAQSLVEAARETHNRLEHEQARKLLTRAAALLKEDEGELRYDVHLLLGDILRNTGHLEESIEAYETALHDTVVLDDMHKGAEAYVRLGQSLAARGEYSQAEEMVRRARDLYSKLGDQEGIASSLDALGRAIWLKGAEHAYRDALTHFLKALALRRKLNDTEGITSSLTNLARVHLGKGYALHARKYFDEAVSLFERRNDMWGTVDALIGAGASWIEADQPRRALEVWGRAAAIAEEIGDRQSLCILLNNMGEAYLALDDQASTQVYLREAQEIAAEVGESRVLVDAIRTESLAALRRAEFEKALTKIEEALSGSQKQKSKFHIATCRASRAHVLAVCIDHGVREESSELHREISKAFNDSIQDLERMGDDLQLARVLQDYARYLKTQGVDRHRTVGQQANQILGRLKERPPEEQG